MADVDHIRQRGWTGWDITFWIALFSVFSFFMGVQFGVNGLSKAIKSGACVYDSEAGEFKWNHDEE